MKQNLYKFYEALENIRFQQNLEEYNKKFEELTKIINTFQDDVKKIGLDSVVKRNKDLKKLFNEMLENLKDFPDRISKYFLELSEKEKFRNELSNYFIVMVFGKVKAGKSSLGNFIIENRLKNQKVKIFKYDKAGKKQTIKRFEEIDEEGFAVKSTECTTEIQGFTLGGMAWIDTPGLGSMTFQNGELAKEYINSADYIIYPTNSAAPLQRDELEELKKLFNENKKITICITKSDIIEEDECECGSEEGCEKCEAGIIRKIVNKSKEDREKQEEWVKGEIKKILIELDKEEALLGEVLSISVLAAKEGLKNNDKKLFENSNIEKFYDIIRVIVEKKAVELKKHTPYENLKVLVDKFLGDNEKKEISIKKLEKIINEINKNINEKLNKFEELKKDTEIDIINIIESVTLEKVVNFKKSNAEAIFSLVDKEIKEQIEAKLEKNIQEILEDFRVNLNDLTLKTDEFKIKDIYKPIKITYDDSSLIREVLHVVTFGYIEKSYKTVRDKIYLGDNKEEVIKSFKENRLVEFNKFVKNSYEKIENEFFKPLQDELQKINKKMDNLKKEFKNFKVDLKV